MINVTQMGSTCKRSEKLFMFSINWCIVGVFPFEVDVICGISQRRLLLQKAVV